MQAKVYEYFKQPNKEQILLVEDDKEALICAQAATFAGLNVFILPDLRISFGDDLRSFNLELLELCKVLSKYYKCKENKLIISPFRTLLNPLPTASHLKSIVLNFADKINLNQLQDQLQRLGYEPTSMVQSEGEFSIRGSVIDIFALNLQEPVRLVLFDDEIESIRYYDVSSQISQKNELESVEIVPFLANLSQSEKEVVDDKISKINSGALINDIASLGFWAIDDFIDYINNFSLIFANKPNFDDNNQANRFSDIAYLPLPKKYKDLQISVTPDFFYFHSDKNIKILAKNESLFLAFNVPNSNNINRIISPLVFNVSNDDEIIISLNKFDKKRRRSKASIAVDELRINDFVVHQNYGIGKFLGLENITALGAKREFVSILYQDGDKLLLPVENLNLIDRYISSNSGVAVLDKLGKASFSKLKEKVREKLFIIANKIISLAAKRELIIGEKIDINQKDHIDFMSKAGFIYTSDQERAVNDILNELKSGKAMDRLLSGDVGFGKTEVAMNAIFACIKSGFKALFFVPTTLLCAQHFNSVYSRFKDYGLKVYRLDRFSTSKQKASIKSALLCDEPCVVIGTHSLLSLQIQKLGLIVIDEEHKFGVKQKEKLKELSSSAHLLSMSATPIPRSLSMALSKLKTYSTLLTPPSSRLDVRTFVREHNDALVKEAINRELRRGGQIFYIHNHIATMQSVKKYLHDLMPNLRILSLHSKIDPKVTEDEMIKFTNKEYDLLLCTSIVESGIHLPNVNTIIIESANKFGIADLHQLRGRVGRSNKQAYCYYLIGDDVVLSDDAKRRLVALESNSFLGSGSLLAQHDLEIRGGGNLIGEAQSGHIEAIGYSLYLKMLEDEINKLLNHQSTQAKEIDLRIGVSAFLNEELINDDRLRLELYRRLSKAEDLAGVYEISSEIEDRFGKLDIYTKQFIELILIKIMALKVGVKSISSSGQNILIKFENENTQRLNSKSKDDDDVLDCIGSYLRGLAK